MMRLDYVLKILTSLWVKPIIAPNNCGDISLLGSVLTTTSHHHLGLPLGMVILIFQEIGAIPIRF